MAKHAVPKQKQSKGRTSRRYTSFQNYARIRLADSIPLRECPKCKAVLVAHKACGECGFYNGKDILGKAKKAEQKVTKIQA